MMRANNSKGFDFHLDHAGGGGGEKKDFDAVVHYDLVDVLHDDAEEKWRVLHSHVVHPDVQRNYSRRRRRR